MSALTSLDHLLAFVLIVALPVEGAITMRWLRRDPTRRRMFEYRVLLAVEWGLAATALGIWLWRARPWSDLGLGLPLGWGTLVAAVMAAAIIALLSLQLRKIRDSARIQEHLRGSMASVQALLPHSPREMRWFTAVAVSAGVCEELLYRGWMIWYFHQMMPLWLAVVAACTAFGLAHAYQGPAGIPKTGIVGAVMAAMYLLAGSLWIPMIVHALVDINGGKIGLLVFGGGKPKGDVASPAASPAMPSARESEADTTSSPARATLQHS